MQKTDVRVIAATNRDLLEHTQDGKFREDLYYRLNIISIALPPLRERGDDALSLAHFYLSRYVRELGRKPMHFTTKALKAIKEYGWPGNVRELQNLVQRLVIMADDNEIDVSDLPESFRFSAMRSRGLGRRLEDVEREYILDVFNAHARNVSRTALTLGIDRKTLRERLKKFGESGKA